MLPLLGVQGGGGEVEGSEVASVTPDLCAAENEDGQKGVVLFCVVVTAWAAAGLPLLLPTLFADTAATHKPTAAVGFLSDEMVGPEVETGSEPLSGRIRSLHSAEDLESGQKG